MQAREDPRFQSHGIMFRIEVPSACAPSSLRASVDIASSALAKAVSQNLQSRAYIPIPLGFTYVDCNADVHRALKGLADTGAIS